MDALQQSNTLEAKNQEVADLRREVDSLKVMFDDLEQHVRRGSMRVFGVPEHTMGTVDDKVLSLLNQHLKVTPPLVLENIEVMHHLGKAPPSLLSLAPHRAKMMMTSLALILISPNQDDKSGTDVDQSSQSPPLPTTPLCAIIVKFASRRNKWRVKWNKKKP